MADLRRYVKRVCGQLPQAVMLAGDGERFATIVADAVAARQGIAAWAACSVEADGPFAGVSTLLQQVAAAAERAGLSSLVRAHDSSLGLLSPTLARGYPPRYPILTFTVPFADSVRTFGRDYAARAINGAIDFLFALQDKLGGAMLCLGLVDIDRGGALAQDFLHTLARRGGTRKLMLWSSAATVEAAGGWAPTCLRSSMLSLPPAVSRPAVSPAGAAEALFGHAIHEHLGAGRPEAALSLIRDAGHWCLRRGFVTDALRYAEWGDALGAEPEWPRLKTLMRAALAADDFPRTETLVRRALELPLEPRARANCLYIMAMLHTRYYPEQDLPRALDYAEQSVAALAGSPELNVRVFYRNGLALVLMRLGRLIEALALCQSCLADLEAGSRPDEWLLHKAILTHNVARVYSAVRKPEEALRYFTAALAIDPYYAELYLERGMLLLRTGRPAEALVDFQRGIEYGPPSAVLHVACGNARMVMGRPAEALPEFDRALELEPDMPQAFQGRALCRYDLGLPEGALADYDEYLSRQPSDVEALVNRGNLRHDIGDTAGALRDFAAALRINPQHVEALANQAVVLAGAGAWAEALAAIDQAIAIAPDNQLLLQNRDALQKAADGA